MAKKSKNSRADSRANDIITYKILGALVLAALCVFILMAISSRYQIGSQFAAVNRALLYTGIAAGLVALLGFILLIVNRFVDKKVVRVTGTILLPLGLAVWLSCLAMYYFFVNAITMLCFFYPSAAVLYLIYLIYQTEFFAMSVDAVACAFGYFMLSKLLAHSPLSHIGILVIVGIALVNIALLALAFVAKKSGGKLTFGKLQIRFLAFPLSFKLICVTAALLLLGLVLSVILGAMAAYCFLFIDLAYLFILAVYYTVKLM